MASELKKIVKPICILYLKDLKKGIVYRVRLPFIYKIYNKTGLAMCLFLEKNRRKNGVPSSKLYYERCAIVQKYREGKMK